MEDLTWKYILWYNDQMDAGYAPSKSVKAELVVRGIQPEKILIYPRGIDIERFHPFKRKGKNLHILAEAFKSLTRTHQHTHLIVAGDGPYTEAMQALLRGTPCTFTVTCLLNRSDPAPWQSDFHIIPKR
jgi:glycosyltransferase involved in cell wall biosynthesis